MMNDPEKSDALIVATKPANAAENRRGVGGAKGSGRGNAIQINISEHSGGKACPRVWTVYDQLVAIPKVGARCGSSLAGSVRGAQ